MQRFGNLRVNRDRGDEAINLNLSQSADLEQFRATVDNKAKDGVPSYVNGDEPTPEG
jgi:hypothetical protein